MRTLDDLAPSGQAADGSALKGATVLVRADFNVPISVVEGTRVITDDGRIRAALPTLATLLAGGARVVIAAHLGRPKGVPQDALSLAPVAARLSELLGVEVTLAPAVTGPAVDVALEACGPGEVLMLENVRFDPRETSKDPAERAALAAELASLADFFVSDGFGVVHREQASVTDVARLLPSAAGRLVEREAKVFSAILADPARPFVVILGGSKVSDKLGVIGNLITRVDRLVIGGGMAYTFLAAQGHGVGTSLLEADQIETVRGFMEQARTAGVELILPVDFVVANEFAPDAQTQIVNAEEIPDDWMGLDIGPRTRELFAQAIQGAGTVVWNGPVGVFEMEAFSAGTRSVAESVSACEGFTVIGGGDSAAAIRLLGLDESTFSHISTGGGASLEFLEGKVLPGLTVLEGQPQ